MNQIVETLNIKGYEVHIAYDTCPIHPREWGGYASIICTAHRSYRIGDVELTHNAESLEKAFDLHLNEKGLSRKDIIYLPVYLYEHGGITISTTPFYDRWDSGQVGYIYETRSEVRMMHHVQRISTNTEILVEDRLRGEIEELDIYLRGEVYRYYIPAIEEGSSGFYGSNHYRSCLIEEAESYIEYHIRQQQNDTQTV